MEKSPSVGQGSGVNSESFVQMDRGHQHYQERGSSQNRERQRPAARRPSGRRAN